MTEQSPAKWFACLSAQNKTIILNMLMLQFTLIIRDLTTSPFDDMTLRRVRGIGEMIHRITPYLISLATGDKDRFSDEELIELLFEMGAPYGMDGAFQQAWHRATLIKLPHAN